jgi:hypothetical protein
VSGVGSGLNTRISSAAAASAPGCSSVVFHDRTRDPALGLRPNITAALLEAARELSQPRHLQTTLDTVVTSAAQSLPDIDHVGITVAGSDASMKTLASSDPFVTELDELQYQLGEGTRVHAIRAEAVTTVNWAGRDTRRPSARRAEKRPSLPRSGLTRAPGPRGPT